MAAPMSTPISTPAFPGQIPPPPGVTPVVDRPSPILTLWVTATTVQLAFPTISMVLRLYVRPVVIGTWTAVDTVFTAAWMFFVATIGLGYLFPVYGIGDHAWNVSPERYTKFLQVENIQQAVYEIAICLSKTAILLQLGEIFAPGTVYMGRKWILRGIIVVNAVFFISEFFLRIFECLPREKIWRPDLPGSCINVQKAFVSTGAMNVAEDFIILALPMLWIYWLNLPTRRKVTVTLVFAAGFFVCACSIMRLISSITIVGAEDLTYQMVPVSLWATAEESATLTICGFPLVPRLYKHLKRIRDENTSQSVRPGGSNRRPDPHSLSTRNLTYIDHQSDVSRVVERNTEFEILTPPQTADRSPSLSKTINASIECSPARGADMV